ncbi:MAG: thioredoxin family protein [Tuberibacillus sp.]
MDHYEKTTSISPRVLFFTTPMCGTCQLAREMLRICLASLPPKIPTYECRVSEWQPYVQKWKIESVPCLVFEKKGELLEKVYAMESVYNLFALYKKYIN